MITVLQRRMSVHTSHFDEQQAFSSLHWGDLFGRFQEVVVQAGEVDAMVHTKALALVHQHLQRQATVSAYQDGFVLLTIMTLAVMPLVCFLRKWQGD
jgi:hypothetical protein